MSTDRARLDAVTLLVLAAGDAMFEAIKTYTKGERAMVESREGVSTVIENPDPDLGTPETDLQDAVWRWEALSRHLRR